MNSNTTAAVRDIHNTLDPMYDPADRYAAGDLEWAARAHAEAAAADAAAAPTVRSVRPSGQSTYRYYILVDAAGERVTDRSFDTRAAAVKYVARNWGA